MSTIGFSKQERKEMLEPLFNRWRALVTEAFDKVPYQKEAETVEISNSDLTQVRHVILTILKAATKLQTINKSEIPLQLLQTSNRLCALSNCREDEDKQVFDHPDIVTAYMDFLDAGGQIIIFIKTKK